MSNNTNYTFRFTGWPRPEDEEDDFDKWAREVREAAGVQAPKPKKVLWHGYPRAGQILWSGRITVKNPSNTGTIYGISSGPPDNGNK